MTITKSINEYVKHQNFGKPFDINKVMSIKHLDCNANTVSTILSRKVKTGELRRVTKGIYYRPKKNRFGYEPIKSDVLIKTLTQHHNTSYVFSGLRAVNALGFSTQLSMTRSYIVSQRLRYNNLKKHKIKIAYSESFKYFDEHLDIKNKSNRHYALLLWSAIRYLDKEKTKEYKEQIIHSIKDSLSNEEQNMFFKALPKSMYWVRDIKEEIK